MKSDKKLACSKFYNRLNIYKGVVTVASETGKVHVQVNRSLNKAFSIT